MLRGVAMYISNRRLEGCSSTRWRSRCWWLQKGSAIARRGCSPRRERTKASWVTPIAHARSATRWARSSAPAKR